MKTMILYATKHGASKEIAEIIASQWDGAELCNLKENTNPALDEYGCVIVGGSLYAGNLLKPVKDYVRNHEPVLLGKQLGLFLSGLGPDGEARFFSTNFPPSILEKAKAKAFLGGIYDPQRCNWSERLIMKLISKALKLPLPAHTIAEDKIAAFVTALKA